MGIFSMPDIAPNVLSKNLLCKNLLPFCYRLFFGNGLLLTSHIVVRRGDIFSGLKRSRGGEGGGHATTRDGDGL